MFGTDEVRLEFIIGDSRNRTRGESRHDAVSGSPCYITRRFSKNPVCVKIQLVKIQTPLKRRENTALFSADLLIYLPQNRTLHSNLNAD